MLLSFKHIIRGILLIAVLVTFSTCKKENLCDCFKGTGSETTVERTVEGDFKELYIEDKLDVHLIQGTEYSIKITGGKHVVKLVKTELKNGVLYVRDDNKCGFTRSYKKKITVYITLPALYRLTNDGVGDVVMDNQFVCDTLYYSMPNSGNLYLDLNANVVFGGMHGNGDVHMKGTIHNNSVFAGGQGYYYGFDAISENVILTLNTSGRMEVHPNSYLKIDMYQRSTGDIYYKGNPPLIEKATFAGSGKLVDKN